MRILFTTGGSMGTVFPQVPLARAAHAAGHEILVTGPDSLVGVIAEAGLPSLSVSPQKKQNLATDLSDDPKENMRYVGRWYGRLTMETLEPLRKVARGWRPDVVVGGGISYQTVLLGREIGVPTVRQPWGVLDTSEYDIGAEEELEPLLQELGLDSLPDADLPLDVIPPSLRRPDRPTGRPMRWIPGNLYRPLEPWMYTRGERPRVLLTSGSRVSNEGTLHTMEVRRLRELAVRFTGIGIETVIAVPEEVAPALRPGPGEDWHVGWIPMDVIVPTCDVIVHHGGVGSNMAAMCAGVPQLVLREVPSLGEMHKQVEFGSMIDLPKEQHTAAGITEACRKLLSDRSYAERARVLSEEIRELPTPAEVMTEIEDLAKG